MPWWAIWQKELFYLNPQQHKLCCIVSAMRPKPCLPLPLLSFCRESHGGEDAKKRRGQKNPRDSTWSLQWGSPLGHGGARARSSFPWHHPWQQWQEAHAPWHCQHPLHMSAHRGASSCCLPGPHNLDRHRFCAGTGALSTELPATSDRLPQQPGEPRQHNTEA